MCGGGQQRLWEKIRQRSTKNTSPHIQVLCFCSRASFHDRTLKCWEGRRTEIIQAFTWTLTQPVKSTLMLGEKQNNAGCVNTLESLSSLGLFLWSVVSPPFFFCCSPTVPSSFMCSVFLLTRRRSSASPQVLLWFFNLTHHCSGVNCRQIFLATLQIISLPQCSSEPCGRVEVQRP